MVDARKAMALLAMGAGLLMANDYGDETAVADYVFGWQVWDGELKLRGGSTKGAPVDFVDGPTTEWSVLQAADSAKARDRAAILNMVGDYKVSFDFMEIEVYTGQGPTQPYRSWATEKVLVIEDSEEFISLQHILVMFHQTKDGTVHGPMVVKHWRQDWTYMPTNVLAYKGHRRWSNEPYDSAEGTWSQSVWQVDDSPRYTMVGQWSHNASVSTFDSEPMWRPLPRREYTVRSDYHILVGPHRLAILPRGWVHTQDAVKTVLNEDGSLDVEQPMLAREMGINRYERIENFDFSAGTDSWAATQEFWKEVREGWSRRLSEGAVTVSTTCGDEKVYEALFGLAGEIEAGKGPRPKKVTQRIDEVLDCATGTTP